MATSKSTPTGQKASTPSAPAEERSSSSAQTWTDPEELDEQDMIRMRARWAARRAQAEKG